MAAVDELKTKIEDILSSHGFEIHPFLTGWYNELVSAKFQLDHPPDTLAFIIISQPRMFENAFLPFLRGSVSSSGDVGLSELQDPVDQCMLHYFSRLETLAPVVETLHDFQLSPSRRPKILVQTAGHVSGAVTFYKPGDYSQLAEKKYFPVCHHPVWGGWFALRGVVIFPNLQTELARPHHGRPLTESQAVQLVSLYNEDWRNWTWRDVGREAPALEKYSDLQRKYFATPPAQRWEILRDFIS